MTTSSESTVDKDIAASVSEDSAMKGVRDEDEEDPTSTCPLFLEEGLPKDFATNQSLAALASLLDESDHVNEEDKEVEDRDTSNLTKTTELTKLPLSCPGGGKFSCSKQGRNQRQKQSAPYVPPKKKRDTKASSSSLGEAQLFLKLWKL